MRLAFLIISHNEFEILQMLVSGLDSGNHDIYIHFDRKVKTLPEIRTRFSRLTVLKDRVDVRWGHVSQIECEYRLWEEAVQNGPYDFYVMLSGVHMPLKRNEDIDSFYGQYAGMEILPYFDTNETFQQTLKMKRYNLFLRGYAYGPKWRQSICQRLWRLSSEVQPLLGLSRNEGCTFRMSSNWVSLTERGVSHLLEIKKDVLKKYRYSFCGDEWFVATELFLSDLKDSIASPKEALLCSIGSANARVFGNEDFEDLVSSGCIFARKFSSEDMEVMEKIKSSLS